MKGSMRILNQHFQLLESTSTELKSLGPLAFHRPSTSVPSDYCRVFSSSTPSKFRHRIRATAASTGSNPASFPGHAFDRIFSLSSSSFSSNQSSSFSFNANPNPNSGSSAWFWASHSKHGGERNLFDGNPPIVTVVILGWLGAKRKHLRRYAELYNARGMNAFVFFIDMKEFICLDLRKMVNDRVKSLGDELFSWLSKREDDGRDRCLLFHTFSNTGFLVYGYLLDLLRESECLHLEEKIRGCIIDSGGGGFMDTKVWAAGWSAALLKKQTSTTIVEVEDRNKLEPEKTSDFVETTVEAVLQKFFSSFLSYPDIQKRLEKIISTLDNPPHCPQLYLYSRVDKVVPFQLIENMVEEQKRICRKVFSYDFKVSPHVDHFRNFPDTYTQLLDSFIEQCFATTKGSCVT